MAEKKALKEELLKQVSGGFEPVASYKFSTGDAFDYKGDLFVYDGPDGKIYSVEESVPMKLYFLTEAEKQYKLTESGMFSVSFIAGRTKPLGKISTLGYQLIG